MTSAQLAAAELARQDRDAAIMLLRFTLSSREDRRRMVLRLMLDSVFQQAAYLGVLPA